MCRYSLLDLRIWNANFAQINRAFFAILLLSARNDRVYELPFVLINILSPSPTSELIDILVFPALLSVLCYNIQEDIKSKTHEALKL